MYTDFIKDKVNGMKVYFIRHGESETNLNGRWTGWLDAPLTGKGKEDAMKAGEYIKNIKFDKVYSSDLRRAENTAEIAIPDCVPEKCSLIREINVGSLSGAVINLSDEDKRRIESSGFGFWGGESKAEFRERLESFLSKLENSDGENVAVFSHGGVLREVADMITGIRIPRDKLICRNCAIAVLEYTDGIRRLHSWINL